MIEVKDLSFGFGKKKVLDRVDFTVAEGSVTGLVGINGAGKSTLLRLISGVYTAKTGEILCDGEKVTAESASKKIFFLPDDPYYTVHATGKSLYMMYKTFYPKIDRAIFEKYMKEFSLNEKKPIRNFSKGMRRQLFVALALAVRPKYLLL